MSAQSSVKAKDMLGRIKSGAIGRASNEGPHEG